MQERLLTSTKQRNKIPITTPKKTFKQININSKSNILVDNPFN